MSATILECRTLLRINPPARKDFFMERMTIKISLNPANPFEARIIEQLQNEKNKAGKLKVLVYERIMINTLIVHAQSLPQQVLEKQGNVAEEKTGIHRELSDHDIDARLSSSLARFDTMEIR